MHKDYLYTSKNMDNLEQLFDNLDALPHGSGIDDQYRITFTTHKLIITNYWHLLNGDGYYMDYLPFKITIPLDNRNDFQLTWLNYKVYKTNIQRAKEYGVTDNIAQLFEQWIAESINK